MDGEVFLLKNNGKCDKRVRRGIVTAAHPPRRR